MKTFVLSLAFVLALAAAGGGGYAIYQQQLDRAELDHLRQEVAAFDPRFAKFKSAVGELTRGFTSLVMEEVDLGKPGWQSIGRGFYLVDVAVAAQGADAGGGVRVKGKIINATSVVHESVVFKARIDKSTAPISFPRAAPAVALPFEIVVPGVAAADAKRMFVALESSTISYVSTAGKSPSVQADFDPAKILQGAN
jgi:hypothetical protein